MVSRDCSDRLSGWRALRQGLDDAAFGNPSVIALVDQAGQFDIQRMEEQGKASEWIGPEMTKPNHGLSVDCEEIMGSGKFDSEFFAEIPTLGNGEEPTFLTGYLVIQSNRSLNVTTVHTAGPRPEKEGKEDVDSKESKDKQPQVHSIAVTNVPEHIRAEFQQHEEPAE